MPNYSTPETRAKNASPAANPPKRAPQWSDPEDLRAWLVLLRAAVRDVAADGLDASRPRRARVLARRVYRAQIRCGLGHVEEMTGLALASLAEASSRTSSDADDRHAVLPPEAVVAMGTTADESATVRP